MRLVFTCCHPALALEAQVALTLKTLCGLTVDEIARAFLVSPATMAQRLVRAKAKIRAARIPYEVPGERPPGGAARRRPARSCTSSSTRATPPPRETPSSAGSSAARPSAWGGSCATLLPASGEVAGLLALMLLHDSRRAARLDARGEVVTLEEQDRTLWDRAAIAEGQALAEEAVRRGGGGFYALQAAIAALHAQAARPEDTDWPQIAALYTLLLRLHPSPVVALNHAAAVAMGERLDRGLRLIEELEAKGELDGYHLLPAAKADILRRLGRSAEAAVAYERALRLVTQPAERRYLERRLREVRTLDESFWRKP